MEKPLNAAIETLQDSHQKLSKEIGGLVSEANERLKSFSTQKLDSVRETLSQAHTAVTDGARQYTDMTDEYVHAHPWQTLGVAAAAGVLIGFLLTRR